MRLLLAIVLIGSACSRGNPAYELGVTSDGSAALVDRAPEVSGDRTADTTALPAVDAMPAADAMLAVDAMPAADAPGASSLLGHWTFEESPGDPMVLDRSGNGHNARLENLDLAAARVAAARGMALSIPASAVNPGAMVPVTSSPIRSLQRFTVAAWVYRLPFAADAEMGIISRQIGTGPRQVFNLAFQDDELVITLSQPTGSEVISLVAGSVKTPVGTWFHVAATWDGAELVLYQGGQSVAAATRSWSLPDTTNPLYLGTNKNTNNDEPLVGMLDDVRLYSAALTADQIVALATD